MEALAVIEEDTEAVVEAGEADCVEKDMILSCKSFLSCLLRYVNQSNSLFSKIIQTIQSGMGKVVLLF